MTSGWFAKMVDRDSGKFPGHIGEVISSFSAWQNAGWGKGLSGRHLVKIIDRDETVFTETWAMLRVEYFREMIAKMFPNAGIKAIIVPRNKDGKIITDKEIRKNVATGFRLMFCPITHFNQLIKSPLFPHTTRSGSSCRNKFGEADWLLEIQKNLHASPSSPYWFWIDCNEKKGMTHSTPGINSSPSLIEYLIADYVLKDEMGRHLDEAGCTKLNHNCEDSQYAVVGGNPIREVPVKKIVNFGRALEDEKGARLPIHARTVARL